VEDDLRRLDQQLVEAQEALRRQHKLESLLEGAQASLAQQAALAQELEARMRREAVDVERLEGRGLVSLFHAVLGDAEQQLERERQEYLAARLRYDEAQAATAVLEREVEDLQGQLAELGAPAARYESLLQEKEELLLRAAGERATTLLSLSETWAGLRSDARELEEAIQAGQQVVASLDEAASQLQSAKNWGTWDVLGGGLLATAVKHSRIDEARQQIHVVQQQLGRFRRELADVAAGGVAEPDIDAFATFADYVFDGLIVDWVVQSRIQNSLQQVLETRARVQGVVDDLHRRLRDTQARASQIEADRRDLIARA
jgi:DNA repair exonuclease SbcCD ATPase subunit